MLRIFQQYEVDHQLLMTMIMTIIIIICVWCLCLVFMFGFGLCFFFASSTRGVELQLVSGTRRQYCSALMFNKCLIKPPLHGVQHKCLINVSLRTNKSDKAAVYSWYGSHMLLAVCSSIIQYTQSA